MCLARLLKISIIYDLKKQTKLWAIFSEPTLLFQTIPLFSKTICQKVSFCVLVSSTYTTTEDKKISRYFSHI